MPCVVVSEQILEHSSHVGLTVEVLAVQPASALFFLGSPFCRFCVHEA